MTGSKQLSYLVISDLHLGHRRTPTTHTIDNVYKYITENIVLFRSIDILFIAGDLMDRLISWPSDDACEITIFMGKLCDFCSENNILLYTLEGTPAHDRKQLRVLSVTLERTHPGVHTYVDTLSIVEIESLGISVLFVPDEWRPDPDDVYSEILVLLEEKGMDMVDIAIMHGQFRHQLPNLPDHVKTHNVVAYEKIVRYWVNIGHIHVHSVCGKILAQGSFPRLSHNEEEEKGGMVMTIGDNPTYRFIPNKHAMIYKTVDIKSKDLDTSMSKLHRIAKSLPDGSALRIRASKSNPIFHELPAIARMYPGLRITSVDSDSKSNTTSEFLTVATPIESGVSITLTVDMVDEVLREAVRDLHNEDLFLEELRKAKESQPTNI